MRYISPPIWLSVLPWGIASLAQRVDISHDPTQINESIQMWILF